jgi:hypothetical protein
MGYDDMTWYEYLKREEEELKEPIIAIAISTSKGPAYYESADIKTLYQDNMNGIDTANTEIMQQLKRVFDGGYGGAEGNPFTAWTKNYVIFPTEYDGSESIARVRRNPAPEPTDHV